jgi:8-oxo-dGTP pyrophosphatase MutT (NUDIX family)
MYIKQQETRTKATLRANDPTHAGGLVHMFCDDVVKYLIVRPKGNADKWVLPKGHIEKGEGDGEAALREVREESGVVARLVCLVDRVRYLAGREKIDVKFYLMESRYEASQGDGREKKWCTFEDAMSLLSYPEGRHTLMEGEKMRRGAVAKDSE